MHSIRVKITAVTVVAIIVSVLSVVGACFFTLRAENDRSSAVEMRLLSQNVQEALDDYIDSIEQSVEMSAIFAGDTLDGVRLVEGGAAGARAGEQTPGQAEALDRYLSEYCARVQETMGSIAGNTLGVAAYYFCLTPEVSRTEHGFFYSKVGKTGFVEQPPIDARALGPDAAWYFTPIQRGRPSWVGPYDDAWSDGQSMISYVVPVYRSGILAGLLGMDIQFDMLVEQIRPVRVYDTGFACLFDSEGRALYHPYLAAGSAPALIDPAILERMRVQENSQDQLLRYTANGEQRQMGFSTLSNGMKLVVTAPVREINASWTRMTRLILQITAVIILLFAVALMLGMRIITRPLQRLTAASRQLADGNYDVRLDYRSRDEVGALTKAFSQMRDRMKRSIADLNHRVHTDDLTDLPNMTYFFLLAETERLRLRKAGMHPVMLYFNLIDMKFFNRQFGFAEGNKLIYEVARILADQFGLERCSRFGGDHFAVVTDEEHMESQLEAVFEACKRANGGNSLAVRVGVYQDRLGEVDVGVACDRAKYACDQYRGTYVSAYYYFDRDMLTRADDNHYIVNNLDRALAEGWIEVCYQPIVRAANGRVCDEEALSRWNDPTRGRLSPGLFIPVLEEARLVHKLDLYVLDQILLKIRRQAQAGLYVVPQSLNLSRTDFDALDIVEEIRRRVDAAGIPREKLTIEITESAVGSDLDFIRKQVKRFRDLGFQVWMDDFGSGYSSLDVLQNIHFDLIKFDMRFMQRFDEAEETRIILTELTKMAIALGIETVAEGVETEAQVDFLREVGCTKLQGFYYCRAIPLEEIVERNRRGVQIGFENPEETGYYTALGRINLYDMSTITVDDADVLGNAFDTMPMAIVESDDAGCAIIRANKTFRTFMRRAFGRSVIARRVPYDAHTDETGAAFMQAIRQCSADGKPAFINEAISDDATAHALVRRIAVNPVTGISACALAVLGITDESARGVTYSRVAQALSTDYIDLYVVSLSTDRFVQYSSPPGKEALSVERHGADFFNTARRDARESLCEGDREKFLSAFTKENVVADIDAHGAFTLTYRLLIDGEPTYVNMKVVRMRPNSDAIIIGVNNVDAQMKQREALERMRDEQITYARITALSGSYICIYTVDPRTGRYSEYSATPDYETLGISKAGEDFFAESRERGAAAVCPDDRPMFLEAFTREKVLDAIREGGIYTLQYRLMIEGAPVRVSVRAALVEERDGPQIIVGVNRIETHTSR